MPRSPFRLFREEYLLDGLREEPGQPKGQGQRGSRLAAFQGVDGLARNAKPLGQISLRPIALRAQDFEAVSQGPALDLVRRLDGRDSPPLKRREAGQARQEDEPIGPVRIPRGNHKGEK